LRPADVLATAGGESISRLHVARALVATGHVGSIAAAFRRWIGNGKPAFVARERPPVAEIIALIHRAGGAAVLAHPGMGVPDDAVAALAGMGLDGIEVFCPYHTWREENHYEEMAKFYDLLISGGSDCHGHNKDQTTLGSIRLAPGHLEALRARAAAHQQEPPDGT
jgi:hypothetical protein